MNLRRTIAPALAATLLALPAGADAHVLKKNRAYTEAKRLSREGAAEAVGKASPFTQPACKRNSAHSVSCKAGFVGEDARGFYDCTAIVTARYRAHNRVSLRRSRWACER